MHFLKSKHFWLAVAHIGIIAGGVSAAVLAPFAAVPIMAGTASINALLTSPLTGVTKSGTTNPVSTPTP